MTLLSVLYARSNSEVDEKGEGILRDTYVTCLSIDLHISALALLHKSRNIA